VPRKETVNHADITTVSLLDLATCAEIERLPELGDDVAGVAYSPDGALLVSGSKGKVRVWSCVERRLLGELGDPNTVIGLLGFRADGTGLLVLAQYLPGRRVRVIWWDTVTWQAVRAFEVEASWLERVSPDGHLLVVCDTRGTVRWLSAETGELLAPAVDAHRRAIQRIAFSGDGLQAASTAMDGTVAIWDLSSFRLITSFQAHMQSANGVAFSPDGRRLATGGNGRDAVKLWDLSTRRELMTLSGQGLIQEVAFSPDGQWLVARGTPGHLHLWHAPSWEEIEAAEKESKSVPSPRQTWLRPEGSYGSE
jgi:WD40 repeat protein